MTEAIRYQHRLTFNPFSYVYIFRTSRLVGALSTTRRATTCHADPIDLIGGLADVFDDRHGAPTGLGHAHSAISHGHVGIVDDPPMVGRTSHKIHSETGAQKSLLHQWQPYRRRLPHASSSRYPISLLYHQLLVMDWLVLMSCMHALPPLYDAVIVIVPIKFYFWLR